MTYPDQPQVTGQPIQPGYPAPQPQAQPGYPAPQPQVQGMEQPPRHAAPESQPDQPQVEPVQDPQPVLTGLAPQFGGQEDTDGVDVDTMPPFRPLERMLPAQRVKLQMDMAKIAKALPANMAQGQTDLDMDQLTEADLDLLVNLFERIQENVLINARDRKAMETWLMDQTNSMGAIMYAFNRLVDTLGN